MRLPHSETIIDGKEHFCIFLSVNHLSKMQEDCLDIIDCRSRTALDIILSNFCNLQKSVRDLAEKIVANFKFSVISHGW